jgi:hypothetical protein
LRGNSADKEKTMLTNKLTDAAIEQIKDDIAAADYTAIEELLRHVPSPYLKGFLGNTIDIPDTLT